MILNVNLVPPLLARKDAIASQGTSVEIMINAYLKSPVANVTEIDRLHVSDNNFLGFLAKCGMGEVVNTCAQALSCQPTCSEPNKPPCVQKRCLAGCVCAPGFIRSDSGICVQETRCPKRENSQWASKIVWFYLLNRQQQKRAKWTKSSKNAARHVLNQFAENHNQKWCAQLFVDQVATANQDSSETQTNNASVKRTVSNQLHLQLKLQPQGQVKMTKLCCYLNFSLFHLQLIVQSMNSSSNAALT